MIDASDIAALVEAYGDAERERGEALMGSTTDWDATAAPRDAAKSALLAAITAAPVVPAGIADEGIVAVAREVERLDDDARRLKLDRAARSSGKAAAASDAFSDHIRTAAPALARYVLAHAALIGGPLGEWRETERRAVAVLGRIEAMGIEAAVGCDAIDAELDAIREARRVVRLALMAALDGLATAVTR